MTDSGEKGKASECHPRTENGPNSAAACEGTGLWRQNSPQNSPPAPGRGEWSRFPENSPLLHPALCRLRKLSAQVLALPICSKKSASKNGLFKKKKIKVEKQRIS